MRNRSPFALCAVCGSVLLLSICMAKATVDSMDWIAVDKLDARQGAPQRQICPRCNRNVRRTYVYRHVCTQDGLWTAESALRWNLHKEQWVGKRVGLACTLYTKSHITAHMCRHRTVFEFRAVYECLCCSSCCSSADIARRVCMQSLSQLDQTRQLFNCITLPSAPCPCS